MISNLKQKLYEITRLLNNQILRIHLVVYDETGYDCEECSIRLNERQIKRIFSEDEYFRDIYFNNVDYIDNDKEEYKKQNGFLLSFLHEYGHHLTKDFVDMNDYYRFSRETIGLSRKERLAEYRKIFSERLADNVAYLIWHYNKDIIYKIFNDKEFIIPNEVVQNNKKIINDFVNHKIERCV